MYGKLKGIIALLVITSFCFLQVPAFAAMTDEAVLGNDRWRVTEDGDLVPGATNTYDLGSSSLYPATIYMGGVGKSSWGSVVSPWEDSGTTTTLTSAPTKFILTHSSGVSSFTGYIAGAADIVLENGQKIDGGTNNAFLLTENSDTLSLTASGDDWVVDSTDGGVIFTLTDATNGTVDIMANDDADDYIQFKTASNVPTIATLGTSNLAIVPDGGTLALTGILTVSGAATVTGILTASTTIVMENAEELINTTNGTISMAGTTSPIFDIFDEGTNNTDAILSLTADAGADSGDTWRINSDGGTNSLFFENDTGGSQATILTLAGNGALTTTGDVVVAGTTPKLTIGDGGDEDVIILYDGVVDYYLANDDSADDFIIGRGGTVATTEYLTFLNDSFQIVVGDASAADSGFTFDGNAIDFTFGIDDNVDTISLSVGTTLGTTEVFKSDGTTMTVTDNLVASGTLTASTTLTATGIATFNEAVVMGSEDVTTTSADPGLGTASIATLVTLVTTDATGTDPDEVSLAAGDAGQFKFVKLVADTETAGLELKADFAGATVQLLFEDVDDGALLVSDGTEWHILINTGGTAS